MTNVNVDDMRAVVSSVRNPADSAVLPARTRTQQRDPDICGYSRPLYAAAVAPHAPRPSSVSAASDAAFSDPDSDYPTAGQRARRCRSHHSVASSQPSSRTSHHSDAMQLAVTLADALKDQLKQACERQERLDRERAAAQQLQQQERAVALDREQREAARLEREQERAYQAALDREERIRSDLRELAEQRAHAAALEEQVKSLHTAATAPPVMSPSSAPIQTMPLDSDAQPAHTQLAGAPVSTGPDMRASLDSLTYTATALPAATTDFDMPPSMVSPVVQPVPAYTVHSALQRAADLYD